MNYFFQVGL